MIGVESAPVEITENAGSGVGATAVFDAGTAGISDGIVVPAGQPGIGRSMTVISNGRSI